MVDQQDNDDQNVNLPPPVIDKSTFPGGGIAGDGNVPSARDSKKRDLTDSSEARDASAAPPTDSTQSANDDAGQTNQPMMPISGITAPPVADDNDLIEKEWVNKAKHIIEQTKADPHIQSNELTLFKADYIKKRYNKTIKTGE